MRIGIFQKTNKSTIPNIFFFIYIIRMEVIYIVIIFALLLIIFKPKCPEGLVSKPNPQEIQKYTSDVISNREVFHGGSFYTAREKMPWIDPIAYEEIRMMARGGTLTKDSIVRVFN